MKSATNDNFPLTFTRIGLAAQRVTDRLRNPHEQADGSREGEADASDRDEQKSEQHKEYVEYRLRELRAFERRIKRVP